MRIHVITVTSNEGLRGHRPCILVVQHGNFKSVDSFVKNLATQLKECRWSRVAGWRAPFVARNNYSCMFFSMSKWDSKYFFTLNEAIFHWYQSHHWYQWTIGIALYPARPHEKKIAVNVWPKQGKSILVPITARFELARVRVIGSRL